jgi:tyrosyl-tRNA synthetase
LTNTAGTSEATRGSAAAALLRRIQETFTSQFEARQKAIADQLDDWYKRATNTDWLDAQRKAANEFLERWEQQQKATMGRFLDQRKATEKRVSDLISRFLPSQEPPAGEAKGD